MATPWELQDATALVTGSSSGIGRAIAEALVGAGCKVIITGRRMKVLEALADELGKAVHPVCLDMTDSDGIAGLPSQLPADFQRPNILVNNAAEDVGGRTRFDVSSAEDLARVIETNLLGVIRMTRAIVPGMLERGAGDILNIGSTNAMRPTPNMAVYTASKAGVHGLTDVLRADYSKAGIRVMEITPGLTRTGFAQARMNGDAEKARTFFEQFPSTLKPEDVADAVLYALSRPRHICVQQVVVTPSFQW
jgi:3-hydroxy acid dehydrogenase/malonic semialdehyde reductase